MVQALDQPIVIAGQPCQVGISIGIALYPAGGKDMDVLVAHADGAMYAAKRAGGRCYKFAGERDADISGPLRLPFFEWSEAHSVGVPLMDEQHKELAGLINRIGEDLKAGHEAERLHESFARLVAGRARALRRRGAAHGARGPGRGRRAPQAGAPPPARGAREPGRRARRPQHVAHHALPQLLAPAPHRNHRQAAREAAHRARQRDRFGRPAAPGRRRRDRRIRAARLEPRLSAAQAGCR